MKGTKKKKTRDILCLSIQNQHADLGWYTHNNLRALNQIFYLIYKDRLFFYSDFYT